MLLTVFVMPVDVILVLCMSLYVTEMLGWYVYATAVACKFQW